jgi:thioredoxin-like negative regulator of GroEL
VYALSDAKTIIEELAAMFIGKVRFLALDVDEHPQIAMNSGIMSIPTIVIYRDGREIERFIGCQAADTLTAVIYRTLAQKKEAKR